MKRVHLWVALALILGGSLYIAIPKAQAAWQRYDGGHQRPRPLVVAPKPMNLERLIALELPRLKLHLAIQEGAYSITNRTWRLDTQHAFYVAPGSIGGRLPATPLLYGHALPNIFQALDGVAAHEQLIVTTANGHKLYFDYAGDQVATPEGSSVLATHLDNTLLVMTCSGNLSESRRVLHFTYEETR